MPKLFGKELTRQELMRRVGDLNQVFGIRPVVCGGGKTTGMQCLEMDNGGGLKLTVAESKALDLLQLNWKGMNLGFETKAGLHAPWLCDEVGMSYRRNLGAGFLYTAGLYNVGGFQEESNEYHYAHGAIKNTPAENISSHVDWEGDECRLTVSGQVRESAFFGRNLLLSRSITTAVGSNSFTITDTIENQDFAPASIMLLYHMNLGFPLLDEDTRMYMKVRSTEVMTEHTHNDADWRVMPAPIDNNEEYLYVHEPEVDADGYACAAAFNHRLGFGLEIKFRPEVLPYVVQWKCMKSGDYALGILPSTCKPIGRAAAAEQGQLVEIKPFEKLHLELQIRILESEEQLCHYDR